MTVFCWFVFLTLYLIVNKDVTIYTVAPYIGA